MVAVLVSAFAINLITQGGVSRARPSLCFGAEAGGHRLAAPRASAGPVRVSGFGGERRFAEPDGHGGSSAGSGSSALKRDRREYGRVDFRRFDSGAGTTSVRFQVPFAGRADPNRDVGRIGDRTCRRAMLAGRPAAAAVRDRSPPGGRVRSSGSGLRRVRAPPPLARDHPQARPPRRRFAKSPREPVGRFG